MSSLKSCPDSGIAIDKEGNWFYQGMEMWRKDIVKYFYEHLKKDETGRYYVEIGSEIGYLEVEDTPYVVKSLEIQPGKGGEQVELLLSDGTKEILDPQTIHVSKDNVPYCQVKGHSFSARFSRPAYYQMAALLKHDPAQGEFYLSLNGNKYNIQTCLGG